MKTYKFEDGTTIVVDKAVEYYQSISRDCEFAESMPGAIQHRFHRSARETYQKATKELGDQEKMVLDRILAANDINPLEL